MRKRVLHIINGLEVGGAEMTLFKLLSYPREAQFETAVLTLVDRGPIAEKIRRLGIRTYSLRMESRLPKPVQLLRLKRFLCEIRPDLR